jgi:hypothetical protein
MSTPQPSCQEKPGAAPGAKATDPGDPSCGARAGWCWLAGRRGVCRSARAWRRAHATAVSAALARCMWACAMLASDVESVCLPRESNAPSRVRRGARGSRPGSGVARTVDEPHRAASQLELVFDLTFVVAVAVAAVVTPARSRSGRAGVRRRSLLQVFFASWWVRMNFTWFGSSHDTESCRTGRSRGVG